MLDQSLLQSHFIGRDGFRWWIGQIAPIESWGDQADHKGWGYRRKVRILGYHPLDDKTLTNEELPWAQVMLPTTSGTGAANYAVNPKLRPGDVVIGFFLDGDNCQIPVIMGALGRTSEYANNANYKFPFGPFTGYTTNVSKPNGRLKPDQTSEETPVSQQSPRQVPPATAERIKEISAFTGIGKEVVFADTCGDTTIKNIKSEVSNLIKLVEEGKGEISKYREKIRKVAEVIKTSINWLVGRMVDALYNFLVGTESRPGMIPLALKALYESVYAAVFAATRSPAAAHTAGYKSNEVFVTPIKVLEEAISCVANKIVEGLTDLIVDILTSALENVKQFVSCAAEQFIGTLLSSVVDQIASGLSSALGGVSALLSSGFDVVDFLTGTVDVIKTLGGLFDCNQNNNKCDGVKEWVVGVGPKKNLNIEESLNRIYDVLSTINVNVENIAGTVEGTINLADIFSEGSPLAESLSLLGDCYTGFPTNCGPPVINIFGGGGIGATAIPILGAAIENASLVQSANRVSGVIGAIITSTGSGYRFPPFVEIVDNCGLGYGAKGRAIINDQGQVTGISMISSGEGYPVSEEYTQENYGVVDVTIQSQGSGYTSNDFAIDSSGNRYTLTVENGLIVKAVPINNVEVSSLPIITVESETGVGAILKPIIGPIAESVVGISTQIDCIV